MTMQAKDGFILSGVIIIWGVNFLAMKFGLNEVPPLILGMLRFLCVLIPTIAFIKKPNTKWRYLIGYGLTISFGQFSLMFLALSWQFPTGLAALILQAQIFLTVLFSYLFLNEKVHSHHLFGMTIGALGLLFIGIGQYQGNLPLLGILPVLGAAISWAFGNIIVKKIGQVEALSLVIWGNVSAFLAFTAFSLLYYGIDNIAHHISHLSYQGILSIFFLAYVANYVGYTGWGYLLARHQASTITPFIMLVPVLALLCGYLILQERLFIWHFIGILTVFFGLSIHLLSSRLFSKNT